MGAKLARWIIFTVLFSLVPLVVDFAAEIARTNTSPQLSDFGRHGELYLLASAICAVGLGEILGVNQKLIVFKIIAGGAAVVLVALSTALYTISASDAAVALAHQAASQAAANDAFSKNVIAYSILIFSFACIVSTSCIVISEVK